MASSNTLLTPTIIAKEALMQLVNNLGMASNVYKAYKNEFVKVGSTITVRKPNKFRATDAQARTNTNISEPSTSITMATQSHVSWAFSSVELTQVIEDYSKRYIAPAAAALANRVDHALCGLYADVYNYAGSPGTTPGSFKVLGDCQTILDDESTPAGRRVAVLNPDANWTLADALKGTFAAKVADNIVTKGYLGTIANLDIYMDQNIRRHKTGVFTTGATPLVEGASQTGATLKTDGWNSTSSTVAKGDIFTIEAVNAVNTMSGESTGKLRRFVVGADTTSTGSGDMATLPIAPSVVAGGAYQTVTASPANDAPLSFVGTQATEYPQNLVFHPNAFALVTTPIEVPANVWGARESDPDTGLSIRVVKQYDIDADEEIIRMDILFGTKTLYPEMACRLFG